MVLVLLEGVGAARVAQMAVSFSMHVRVDVSSVAVLDRDFGHLGSR